ncbi:MAG: ATP-binding cassette domain-containing protein [Clostridia bacterium]|nr:ATP-binding cassette domain-containing protein [Clostridia bacterium]
MKNVVLRAQGVSKQYILGQIGAGTLRDDLDRLFDRVKRKKGNALNELNGKSGDKFWALKDVSFEINEGSAVALIGRNGAGKSTLLKIISRITAPTEGKIQYKGRVASLLEVGTGFNQHLTGRENIYLNGAIMGLSRADIDSRLDEIIDFSEVGQFIDTPVKRYSSGMYVKLGFAVAAHLEPDILICDEVLAVGDTRFQEKCIDKMSKLSAAHTVIYVSHNMHTLRQLCNTALYLENGRLTYAGELEHAIGLYAGSSAMSDTHVDLSALPHIGNMGKLVSLEELDIEDTASNEYPMDGEIKLSIKTNAHESAKGLRLFTLISRPGSGCVATSMSAPIFDAERGDISQIRLSIPLGGLAPGEYDAEIWLCFIDPIGRMVSYDAVPRAFRFSVEQNLERTDGMLWNEKRHGLFRLPDAQGETKLISKANE